LMVESCIKPLGLLKRFPRQWKFLDPWTHFPFNYKMPQMRL
jgi:hypothetical protein